MHKSLVFGLLGLAPFAASAQQTDRWAGADVVRYHIVGVYTGTYHVASDGSGRADISDRVVIDLTWKLSEMKLVGAATVQNTKSVASKLRDREPACLPPVLKGEFDFFDLVAVKEAPGGTLYLESRTIYPVVEVAQFCTDSRRAVPAMVTDDVEEFGVISPTMFAMPLPDGLAVSPDKKSFIVKKDDGWTWTFTPSIAR